MSTDEKIEKAIEGAENNSRSDCAADGSVEFSFGGLVFEDMTGDGNPEVMPEEVKPEPVAEPEPAPAPKEDEFTIPDTFMIDEKYNTPPTPDTPTTIWRTYVPKFTEVSDTYRMQNDPRPRPKTEPKKPAPKAEEEVEETLDPTAELDVAHEDTVEVNVAGNEEADGDTLNVFKFSDVKADAQKVERERTVEDERRDIDKLLTPEPVAEPEPESQPEPEEPEEEEVIFEIKREEPKVYSIPDPTDSLHVVDYGKASREASKYVTPEPEGVSDEPEKTAKRRLGASEFNSQAERDEFKDSFLDSLMSVKIRSIAALVIGLFLVIFENILVVSYNKELATVGIFGGMIGVVDLIFATSLYILALPEVIRSFKYLLHGRLIPELSLTAAYVVELIYTLVVASSHQLGFPLYGFLFGVLAISTVLSAYFRINADFTAFKVISRNTEKQILDKKLTRTLTEENMALDGAIDEYKSRTARIFRAAFISDFFKRTAKVSENTMSTLISLCIALGAALITGVVSYFVSNGIIAAASGFTLVFLLALPAFSVLIHKLPYFDAQNAALDEESTLVGETSYNSFSSVDVIAFEDTDIFGEDDVNLRRFMLYGDKDNMEKAMKQMSSLFATVGGPLDVIFRNTLERRCHPASNVTIEQDGLAGDVDGARIEAGTEEYMLRHNIMIPDVSAKREVGSDTTKIMYAAENGQIYAKFYIRYSFSEQFTSLLPSLKSEGIVPLIYTRDPNVSGELLKTLSAGSDSMRVMRKYHPISDEDKKIYRRVSAELVTYGDKINAINTVLLTKKYKRFGERLSGTELYATVIGAALAVVLALSKMTTIPAVIFSLWQIAWCVVLRIASKNTFPRVNPDKENDK